jgi:hypothetical protein
LVTGL